MGAAEAAAGCRRRAGAGFCQILPDFAGFCRVLPGCSCSSSAAQETQSFVSSSAIFRWQLFLLLFLRADPEPQGWAGPISCPSPPALTPARPRVGFQTCHRVFLLLQIVYLLGFIPACGMGHRDCCPAEAVGFRFIL